MSNMSRRSALKLALGASVAFPSILTSTRAFGADFTLKYANNCPETHPLTIRTREAAAAIKAETNGKVDLQVFPNSQLGGDTDMLAQLRAGGIDFFTLSPLILSMLVPKAAISGIGFAWNGYEKLWPSMDGKLGEFVRGEIKKSGLIAFDKIFDNGFRQISSSARPIKTPEDMSGFKIRVPPSALWTSMFKAFDAAPLSINFSEVYSSLQTKIADGQENPLVTFEAAKLYEVQKFVSKTNHMWDGFWFLAGGKTWNKLPAEVQKVIEKHMAAAAMKEREDVFKLNSSLERDIAGHGITFNSVDPAAFQAKLKSKGFYKEWQGKFGEDLWKLLQTSSGVDL